MTANSLHYYGFVYMWCDIKRNMYYIGSHKGSVQDKYLCSSKWCRRAINKRPKTFKRIVLGYADCRSSLFLLEERYLKFYNVDKNPLFYNFKATANGGSGPHWKGRTKKEVCGPNWVDPRKGKTHEEIYGSEVSAKIKNSISKRNTNFFIENGFGLKKGRKHTKPDWKKGKTHQEIYGYTRYANPPKPFVVIIEEPGGNIYEINCRTESDFFEKTKLDTSALYILKTKGNKKIKRILENTKHDFQLNTILKLKYLSKND